jgi:hypothetical protein
MEHIIMAKLWSLISEQIFQYSVFLGLSVIIFILTGITYISNRASFAKYFGRINPLLAVFIVFIIGLILFTYLLDDGLFAVYRPGNYRGLLLAVVLALPFGAAIILVDRAAPFPIDTNVLYPDSLAFYPVMGYVVEIIFHILPAWFILVSGNCLAMRAATQSSGSVSWWRPRSSRSFKPHLWLARIPFGRWLMSGCTYS